MGWKVSTIEKNVDNRV